MRTVVLQTLFYSPDQERDDHGRFGSGSTEASYNARTTEASRGWLQTNVARMKAQAGAPATPEQKASLNAYISHGDQPMNNLLRYGTEGGPEIRDNIANIDAAMETHVLDKDMVVYRGVDRDRVLPANLNTLVGATFTDKAYVSTSVSGEVADRFSTYQDVRDSVRFQILAPAGTHGIYMPSIAGRNANDEHEFLLPHGTSMKVVGIERGRNAYGDDINIIKATVINGK